MDESTARPSTIRNTTEDMRDPVNASMFLLEQLSSPNPADPTAQITRMEAAGQREVVNSDRLPTEVLHSTDADFEAVGFTFGPADARDPLFRPATLPAGWSRQGSDHNMWSYIVDDLGRRRAAIFYKAAFYDRNAHMSLETPTGYLRHCLWKKEAPILDESWLTRDVARQTLDALAAQTDRQAMEAEDFATRQQGERAEYWLGRAAEHREEARAIRALAESLGAAS